MKDLGNAAQVRAEEEAKLAAARENQEKVAGAGEKVTKDKKEKKPQVNKVAEIVNLVAGAEYLTDEQKKELTDAIMTKFPAKEAKVKGEEGPGIIGSIVNMIVEAGEVGVSKADVYNKLVELFPKHDIFGLTSTIRVQLPARINVEKFPLKKLDNGKYVKAGDWFPKKTKAVKE